MLLSELFSDLEGYRGKIKYVKGAFVGQDPAKPLKIKFLDPSIMFFVLTNEKTGTQIRVNGEEVTIIRREV